jgi:hypothetical protein
MKDSFIYGMIKRDNPEEWKKLQKEALEKRRADTYVCECGVKLQSCSRRSHENSKGHIKYEESLG